MATEYVLALKDADKAENIGNKAARLHFLMTKGFQTPVTYICTWDAYVRYLEGDPTIVQSVRSEIAEKLYSDRPYAVRSSANIEDSLEHSFAGQFKTVLGVRGIEGIIEAIQSVWATAQSPHVQAYLQKNGVDPTGLRMAVLVQEMVPPLVAGVSFSKNPVTGLDEVIVEAVQGSGEALVQGGVTPRRWVNKWGDWIVKPEQEDISLDLIQKVVKQTKAIAKAYGGPVDLEWVYNGLSVYWVQLREITAAQINLYSNKMARELSPGILKPLVFSIGCIPARSWVRIFGELIGPNDLDPDSLARLFYYRMYYNMGTVGQVFELMGMPRETLELMAGVEAVGPDKPRYKPGPKTYRLMPRMMGVAVQKLRFAPKVDAFIRDANKQLRTFRPDQLGRLGERELLAEIDRLYALEDEIGYYTIHAMVLMQIYSQLLKVQLNRIGVDFASFDLTKGMDELHEFDPNARLAELNRQYKQLPEDTQARIAEGTYDEFRRLPGVERLQAGFERFRGKFGYLRDSTIDFSMTPWQENPDLILRMMVNFTPPKDTSATRVTFDDLPISGARARMLRPVYDRARRFRYYREAMGFVHTSGYGLFRPYFLALGDRFVKRGIIDSREDIYYLFLDEVREIVGNDRPPGDYRQKIAHRKRELEEFRDITPPTVIYGDQAPPLEDRATGKLTGTPTSRGHYTGPARVIHGVHEFDKLKDGDVLVIPYSDVAWTPLFTKAGAVVAESGGLLSHSSIIAREYNLPAVVSVAGACQLADDTLISVDGYRGEVIVHAPSNQSIEAQAEGA